MSASEICADVWPTVKPSYVHRTCAAIHTASATVNSFQPRRYGPARRAAWAQASNATTAATRVATSPIRTVNGPGAVVDRTTARPMTAAVDPTTADWNPMVEPGRRADGIALSSGPVLAPLARGGISSVDADSFNGKRPNTLPPWALPAGLRAGLGVVVPFTTADVSTFPRCLPKGVYSGPVSGMVGAPFSFKQSRR